MKHFLAFLSSVLLPLACVGATSYTTYFNNTHTYTNATVAGTSTANRFLATNGVYSLGSGTGGTFVGHPADSEIYWGSSDFTGLSFIDVVGSDTSPFTQLIMGNFISSAPTTRSLLEVSTDTNSVSLALTRRISGTLSGRAELEVDSTGQRLVFGSATQDTFLLRDAANTLAMRNGTTAQTFRIYNTFTDASNYELGSILWNANVFEVGSYKLGSGSSRRVQFVQGSTNIFYIDASTGALLWNSDNSRDIGASGATRPRTIYVGTDVNVGNSVNAGAGSVTANQLIANAAGIISWSGRSQMRSASDGVIRLVNSANNDFNRLDFGGTTASFPALKRSSTELQVRLADDSADGPLKSGQLSNTGIRVMTPSSLQTLAAGNALLANATKVRVVGSGGAVTLTSTPTIADGSDGQYVMIQGTDDTNTLTVQDQGSLASSNLELGAATRVLGAGDVLVLTFDTTASVWYEVSFANN